ncbi:mannose-1-phosphate guanylyltransferase [Parerythrobacter aestuarii]|uniref:mannose-1-phosphate guanylyltransferase n=1 Tax=Parerythrobacter aestuarii TaxID=3020909 RepID=UPI0024DE4BBC|nr:mannose-1-phosphate guanylyltransferase [Parerythrobacter aestuarii]
MSSLIHPVILCGGGGTRLWPRSRQQAPKPFLRLLGERTLFQQTLDRVSDRSVFAAPIVVAGVAHIPLIVEQAAGQDIAIIAEPMGKNTAPAIALAAHRMPAGEVMLVCPSDHYIGDTAAFVGAAQSARQLALDGRLVSFGITPNAPETGYGYIKRGVSLPEGYEIERFVEKPDLETAQQFLAEGGYSWNGGIFAFASDRYLSELAQHRPDMAAKVQAAVSDGASDGITFTPEEASFATIDGDSIDYAVMEATTSAAVVPVSMGWSDIGNWQALRDAREGQSSGPHELVDCVDVMVLSDGPRVSAVGLEDVIIVVDGDEVLVTSGAGAQKVGKLTGASGR